MPHLFRSAIALVFAFCATLASAQDSAGSAAPEYKLSPGDAIKVQVYQNPDLTLEARVSESGSISYPLVGNVPI
ncbi:MAG TPA: polysaccharide biosynthesis/export family protein, partial [Ramlibacter sp.]